jgi:hypothetical protein
MLPWGSTDEVYLNTRAPKSDMSEYSIYDKDIYRDGITEQNHSRNSHIIYLEISEFLQTPKVVTMPITEFALLRLKEPEPSATTKSNLRDVIKEQSTWSKHPVNFVHQIEDSGLVYLLGGWESVAEHFGDWITSEPNQRLLAQLKNAIDIEWLFHLDIDVGIPKFGWAMFAYPAMKIHVD